MSEEEINSLPANLKPATVIKDKINQGENNDF